MADTPDLSRIINLIMENPSLIKEISSLAKNDNTEEKPVEMMQEEKEGTEEAVQTSVHTDGRNERINHRNELLYAMKPYLSESRQNAIDSMVSISGIFEMMKKGR